MTATLLESLGTPFQRLILQEILNPQNDWITSPDGSSITRGASLMGITTRLIFHGDDLGIGSGGLVGSVARIEITARTFVAGQPLGSKTLADITGLDIPSLADFIANAATLLVGEPDFADANTLSFYTAVTPAKTVGTNGRDFFDLFGADFVVNARGGNDVAVFGAGDGTVNLGPGKKDAVDFRNATDPVDLDIATGEARFGADLVVVPSGKFFFGTTFDDTLTGSNDADTIFGRSGEDVIEGLGAADVLRGDAGDDIIRGGEGDDKLFGDSDDDTVVGNRGFDSVHGGTGSDRLFGGFGRDWLYGQKGQDTLSGGAGNDQLFGGKAKDTLLGGKDRDKLTGGMGNDTMTGGSGGDVFIFEGFLADTGKDTITDFTVGDDTIKFENSSSGFVTITKLSSDTEYHIDHLRGEILLTLTAPKETLSFLDLVLV